jgi:hypothetical protein
MMENRWDEIKALFHAAVVRPPNARAVYLDQACAGDERLRAEVESLLVADGAADSVIATPPAVGRALGDLWSAGTSGSIVATLPPGAQLGPYQIIAPLGAGGMGEVYRAGDTKLNRDVALKLLPELFALDPDRLARFTREAQMLAALNHPNIAAIYGLEESSGRQALVLELVDGPTVADLIARGPIPLNEALTIARQITEALEAAHEKGIIHRDLKPANIKIAGNGAVKVLDFGLAKIWEGVPDAQLSGSPTLTATHDREQMILGTPAYMSPEQARGRALDKRTDIWAFGCVLYELLTRARAFPGETTTDVLAVVVGREPDWSALPPATPASIRRLLRRCLEKDPKRRLRDIGDARVELDDAFASPPAATAIPGSWPRARIAAAILGVALAAGALAFILGRVSVTPPAAETVRVHRLTDWTGMEETPAISPDGRTVVYVSYIAGSRQIWVRLVAGGPPLQLTFDAGDHTFPRWSPDSSAIVYYMSPAASGVAGAVWEMPALGGPARRLIDSIGGADVSHDGKRIAFFRFEAGKVELAVTARDGSGARPIAQLETG